MKLGIVGSRTLYIDLSEFIPKEWLSTIEIVSGGAMGIDSCAARFARTHRLKLIEFPPQYEIYGKSAPILRNIEIIQESDYLFIFWDGKSKGTSFVIKECEKRNKGYTLFRLKKDFMG